MKNIIGVISAILLTSFVANASSSFSFNGRLMNGNNLGEEGSNVEFLVSVKVGSCEVYRESHNLNMAGSAGYFSLPIGSGTGSLGQIDNIFNRGTIQGCIGGGSHTVAQADKVTISADVSVAGDQKISISNQEVKAVPFAVSANKLGGVDADKFLQKLTNVTDLKVKQLVDQLLDGTGVRSVYSKSEVDALISAGVSTIDLSGKADVSALNSGLALKANSDLSNVSSIPLGKIPDLSASYVTPGSLSTSLSSYAQSSSLKAVATSGAYSDLTGKPTLGALAAKSSIQTPDMMAVLPAGVCGVNQTMYYSSATDKLECRNISGDLSVGSIKASKSIAGAIGTLSGNSLDFDGGNAVVGSHTCAAGISIAGLVSGGVYTFVNTDTSPTMCTFSGLIGGTTAATFKFSPANAVRTASSHTAYSFLVVGSTVYVSWSTGF